MRSRRPSTLRGAYIDFDRSYHLFHPGLHVGGPKKLPLRYGGCTYITTIVYNPGMSDAKWQRAVYLSLKTTFKYVPRPTAINEEEAPNGRRERYAA